MNHPLRRSLAFLCALGLLCSLMAAWPLRASAEVITFRFTLNPAAHGESVHINVAIQSDTAPSAGGGFSRFTITISRRDTELVNSNYREPNDRVIMGIALSIGTLRYTNDQPQDQALDFVCKVYRSGSLVGESTRNGYVPSIIHQFTRTTTQQSCTTAEAVIDTCDICGFVERTETAPALGHDIAYQHVAGSAGRESRHLKICRRDNSHNLEEDCPLEVVGGYPPNCTNTGQRLMQCHACQYGFAETLEALGHDWAFFRSNQDGSHSMVCRREISHVEPASPCQYDITASPPICTTVGITSRLCQLCQYAPPDSITAPLGHDWGPWTSGLNGNHSRSCQRDSSHTETYPCEYTTLITLPGCTEPGHTTHTCGLCGHSYVDGATEPLGHDWGPWASGLNGSHSRSCQRDSGHTETKPCEYTALITPPGCTEPGHTTHSCGLCGHSYVDAVTEPLGHDWTDWISQEDGTHRHSCLRDSSHNETSPCEYVDAVTPPTCTEAGFTTHTCAVCGHAYTDAHTEPLGHDWTDWSSQEDGTHRRSCNRDNSHTETSPCEYADAITPPACTETGFTTHTCAVCGHGFTDAHTDPLSHDWAAWASQEDGTHSRSCLRDSSHTETKPCEYVDAITPPYCIEAGFTTHTCVVCGHAYSDAHTEPLGHDWAAWVSQEDCTHHRSCLRDSSHSDTKPCEHAVVITPPTCTETGFTTHTCTVCGHAYTDGHTEPLGHDWAAWISQEDGTHRRSCLRDNSHTNTKPCEYADAITPPTCTNIGFTTHTCAVCGHAYTDGHTEPLGHDWTDWSSQGDGTHRRSCNRDNSHSETKPCEYVDAITPPTCTNTGFTTHTCAVCGHAYTDAHTEPLGHDWTDWTSQEDGMHYHSCLRDSSHSETNPCEYVDTITPPTCTEPGYTTHTCAICGHDYTDAHTDPLGHDWPDWASQEDGTHSRSCLRDSSHTETSPCEYADVITPPTCTETGFTTHTCAVCGHTHVDTRVDPLGHDWTDWTSQEDGTHRRSCLRDSSHTETKPCEYAVAIALPTCTEVGFNTHTCAVCGHAYADGHTEPLGHDWTDWTSQGDGTHGRFCLRDSSHAETKPCEYAVAITPPNCAEPGYTTHTCAICCHAYTDAHTEPLGHDWTDWTSQENGTHRCSCNRDSSHAETKSCEYAVVIIPPTCTEPGYTIHTCAVCGYTYTDTHTEPLGHEPGDWIISQAPSSQTTGLETRHCLACGLLLAERILPRLRSMRYQNTACIGGPRFRDSLPELTSLWYSYALVDLQQEGRTSYPLIASNRSCIGTVHLDIQEGRLTVSYQVFLRRWHLREEYLNFFPSLAAVRSEDLEHLSPDSFAFGQPIPLSDLPQESGQSLLFLRLLLDYDAFDEGLAAGF